MSGHNEFVIGDHQLTIEEIVRIARDKNVKVTLSEQTKSKILAARKVVEELVAEKKVVYGVTTGFGMFKTEAISSDKVQDLQKNLIRSHAIGTGAPFSEEVVRAAILIRANSLSHGHSGVRLELIELLLSVLNAGLYPYVPCKGSVGASGDLAPLSHLTLVMMGEGEVWEDGARIPAGPILQQKNLTPIVLEAKEGLAMNNGTSFMTAVACLNVFQGELLVKQYDLILGLTLEAVSGTLAAYEERVHALRPHKGQGICAANIRTICAGSQILAS
ncbi:MAG: aromatic amino acid ammonia-lyase, partial [Candidatus Komeilibacteria bacterium]|nr:aromatic amino acid ammonia-lyase [Candidatus Komeilibacteria bacterium]